MKYMNAIIFYPGDIPGEPLKARKYRKVQSLDKLFTWLKNNKAGHWEYANIYDHKTKAFIERVYQ